MITRKHLPRRTFLRGLGVAIGLPLLDAMTPALAGSRGATPPRRMAFAYVPNGVDMPNWTPRSAGRDFELPKILETLAPYRDDILVLSGLTHNNGRALGDGPGDHARAAASYLTGVHPRKTAGADIHNGISVDQVAAQQLGAQTRFASLELGCEHGGLAGNCDSGYSCAYTNSLAWRSPTSPLPPEVNPRLVFERLFGAPDGPDPGSRARSQRYQRSILDFVQDDARRLMGDLGAADRRKLDEYLFAVREIEKRIETAEQQHAPIDPGMAPPRGIPVEFRDHVRLMYELLAVAFQTDLTRVATFMYGREGSNRTYREIGVPDAHHGLSHHQGDPDKIARICKINCFHMEQFAWFLGKLKSIPEGDGTLLDNLMVVYGSGLADGNRHTHHDLPVILAGRGGGAIRPGRHLVYPQETPMTNLYLTMLDIMGAKMESLGDSNGELKELSGLS